MIRSTLSFCALFGALILGSKLLQESSRSESSQPESTAPRTLGNRGPAEQGSDRTVVPARESREAHPGAVAVPFVEAISFVSYEDDLTDDFRDPDDNDAPPRPARELADLLKDEASDETSAPEKPTQSEPEDLEDGETGDKKASDKK